MLSVSLLGVPLDLGTENLGVDIGPNAFRYQGLIQKLEQAGINISDLGNVTCKEKIALSVGNPKLKYLDEILQVSKKSAKIVDCEIQKGNKILILGGDHSVTLGAFSGASIALKGNLGLIYFDAHGDLNTDKTTLTGNIHGMHLASLLGFGEARLVNAYKQGAKLKKENLVHIGGCDFDKAEAELVVENNLHTFSILDLLTHGMQPLLKLIDNLQSKVDNIWVSLDLDAIDTMYAPRTGMPNRGGLSYREIAALAEYVGSHCTVIGMDIVEYSPLQDVKQKTAELGIELIAKFLGYNYSWYTNYLKKNKLA